MVHYNIKITDVLINFRLICLIRSEILKTKKANPQMIFLGIAVALIVLGNIISMITQNAFYAFGIPVICGGIIMSVALYIKRATYFSYRASVAFDAKAYDKAIEYYKKAIDVPDCPQLITIIYSYRLLTIGRLQDAKDVMNKVNRTNLDDNGKFNYDATAALITWKEGNVKQAILTYEKLLETRQSELVYETLGFLLLCNEEYSKAVNLSLTGTKLYPNSLVIKDNLATAYFYTYEDKKARKLYKELIEQNANFPEPYYYFGRIAYEDEKYKLALKNLKLALEKPESYLSHLEHKHVEELLEEVEEALAKVAELESALEENKVDMVDDDDLETFSSEDDEELEDDASNYNETLEDDTSDYDEELEDDASDYNETLEDDALDYDEDAVTSKAKTIEKM